MVPVAQVGANQILGQKTIEWRRIFGRRKDVSVVAGPPIDLSRFAGMKPTNDVLDEMTDHMIDVKIRDQRQRPRVPFIAKPSRPDSPSVSKADRQARTVTAVTPC